MASTPASASGSKRKAEVMDAFDELAPSASSSASIPMKRPSYDVFINHRGPDVKSTVATALYEMLTKGHDLSVFLDEPELENGDFFPQTLQAAMSSALVHIAIFSESYAESPWCLADLSFMVKSDAPIIPIFYHVHPTDLRWVHQGKGKYVHAFDGYVQKDRYLGKLNEWKKALYKASFYKGEVIQKKEQLKDIVNSVLKIVKRESVWVADHPVGMEEIVEDFEKNTIHSMKVDQGVQIIGIWGMGGSGKTTLANELYNKKSSLFKWFSFVSNVRDASTKGLLHERQQKLLKDLCVQDVGFFNIQEGKETLSRHLRSVKVFIVLDDVDHVDQLAALMPAKDKLESGSLIIVTTREYDVLKSWPVTTIYKMKALHPIYAKQLFCWHAFEQPLHQDGFEELVEKFLEACNSLPLSLKVIARQLKGELDKEIWKSLLHKIRTVVPNDIKEILKISFDSLDHQEKEMFLDVACFFIGEESSLVIELWNGLGWSGQQGLKSLFNKCLVEYDEDIIKIIKMHDHIRDLGRSIATSQSPYRFGLPHNQIEVVPSGGSPFSICPCPMSALTADFRNRIQTRIGIHGIIVTPDRVVRRHLDYLGGEKSYPEMVRITGEVDDFRVWCSEQELKVDTNCGIQSLSPSLVGLKYLVISGDIFSEVLGEVSRELVWLRWFRIGQPNLPPGLLMKNLRVLEIFEDYHYEEYEEDYYSYEPPEDYGEDREDYEKNHGEDSEDCVENPEDYEDDSEGYGEDHGYYEENHGEDSEEYVEDPEDYEEEHGDHRLEKLWVDSEAPVQLRHLLIYDCYQFEGFPKSIGRLNHLKQIVITNGSSVTSLPDEFGFLKSLEHLLVLESELVSLPINFGNLSSLRHLDLSGSRVLRRLPASFKNLMLLQHLNLSWCNDLTFKSEEELNCLQNITKLEYLNLEGCEQLEELPRHIANNMSLRQLDFRRTRLRELPEKIGQLRKLREMRIEYVLLTSLPASLGCLSFLTNLYITNCGKLECLPDSLGCLSSLTILNIENCEKLECLPDSLGCLSSLTNLEIRFCGKLKCLPDSLGCLSSLTDLHINCQKLECLPDSLGCLSSLTNLEIKNCWELECLPDSVGCLSSLTNLEITNCWELECLPDSLGCLSSLTTLNIEVCEKLECLPDSLRCLSSLRTLNIDDCHKLECLPDSLGCLSSLTNLEIRFCGKLKCLPDSLGCLSSLTNLNIRYCAELDRLGVKSLPKAIRQLSNLQSLIIDNCPISGSSLSFGSSNLKYIKLRQTEVCRISCSSRLERLDVQENHHLEEIEALPRSLQSIYLRNCEMLMKIANFARLTSLGEFYLEGGNRIEKIEGIENCIGVEVLRVESRMEVPGIESLEHLRNLRELKLIANKGAVIERCIQRMQEWPSETTIICARAVPDAASLVQSLLSPNLDIVDSISNQKLQSRPKLVNTRSSHGDVLMLCFVINCVSSQETLHINHEKGTYYGGTKVEKGRWAWVGVFHISDAEYYIYPDLDGRGEEDEVEKGLAVMGEGITLMEEFRSLLPLLFQSQ